MSSKILYIFLLLLSSINCIDITGILAKLKSYLQNNVDNDKFIVFMDSLKTILYRDFPDHLSKNKEAFKNHLATIKENKGYIEDQSKYKDMSYGLMPLSGNGCELIAIYNALYELTGNINIDFPLIVDIHEKDGMVLGGLFGTSILSIEKYFIKNGFPTKSSSKKEDYENIAKGSDVLILTIYNNKEDITDQVHTIAITKKNGKYFVHNNGSNSALTGYDSITAVLKKINSGKAKDIFLVGINKK